VSVPNITINEIKDGIAYFNESEKDNIVHCIVWQISQKLSSKVNSITCNQSLAHLTTMEADATLLDWFKLLNVGGKLFLTLPDTNYWAKLWLDAEWTESTLKDSTSPARRAFSGIFGSQQTGNPKFDNYSSFHSDVFKSGYNEQRLRFLLERAGFVDINIESENGVIEASAEKSMEFGERQIAPNYENIRQDHQNRYRFACEQLEGCEPKKILDLACGIGYGTLMLAKETRAKVVGVDIDHGAIEYANKYYSNCDTNFICEDAQKCQFQANSFDAIVSFETIEHVPFDRELLTIFNRALKVGGRFICSTPNQDIMPFDPKKFSFHLKHYKNSELVALLSDSGFTDIKLYAQMDPNAGAVVDGENGCFTIAIASK
jgi:2-polyprenyl-3-methyl-5-hydroxy-6-metoxy-1,4-benzoquinol methylase